MILNVEQIFALKTIMDQLMFDPEVKVPTGLSLLFARIYKTLKDEYTIADNVFLDKIADVRDMYIQKDDNGQYVMHDETRINPDGTSVKVTTYVFKTDNDKMAYVNATADKFEEYGKTEVDIAINPIPSKMVTFKSIDVGYIPLKYMSELSTIIAD